MSLLEGVFAVLAGLNFRRGFLFIWHLIVWSI